MVRRNGAEMQTQHRQFESQSGLILKIFLRRYLAKSSAFLEIINDTKDALNKGSPHNSRVFSDYVNHVFLRKRVSSVLKVFLAKSLKISR